MLVAVCHGRPFIGFDPIDRDASPMGVRQCEAILCANVALLRRAPVPKRAQRRIFLNASALLIGKSEKELSTGVALIGSHTRPFRK